MVLINQLLDERSRVCHTSDKMQETTAPLPFYGYDSNRALKARSLTLWKYIDEIL